MVSNTTMRLLNLTCTIRFIIRSRTISIKTISINWLTKNAQFSHKLSSDVISIMLWRILRDRRFVLRSTLLVLAEKTEIFLNQAREILICVEREWENNEHVMFSNNTCNFWYFTLIFHSSKRHIKHFSWVCLYWRVIHFSIYDSN